jgi:hypothetical protein
MAQKGRITSMSDTGEQGMAAGDPADNAGVGGGLVPDDQDEGYEQAQELVEHEGDESAGESASDPDPAADD